MYVIIIFLITGERETEKRERDEREREHLVRRQVDVLVWS
jgi:hypothetical protein